MRLRSFTAVILRIIGLMSIIYGMVTLIFILVTLSMISGASEFGMRGMGSLIWIQLLLPILMCFIGVLFIAGSRSLANLLCGGLEE